MSLDERPRGFARPTAKEHYNSLPRTSIEGALGSRVYLSLAKLHKQLPTCLTLVRWSSRRRESPLRAGPIGRGAPEVGPIPLGIMRPPQVPERRRASGSGE